MKQYPPQALNNTALSTLTLDGAWKKGCTWSGLGFCASSMDGSVVQLFSASAYTSSPLQTELLAILLAIHWALFSQFYNGTSVY